MKHTTQLLVIVGLMCIVGSVYAVDLNAPGTKKITVGSEIERGCSEAADVSQVDLGAPRVSFKKVTDSLDMVFQQNKRNNTDSPGFMLGASFSSWFNLALWLDVLKDKSLVSNADYESGEWWAVFYFKAFRNAQKSLGIDDKAVIGACKMRYNPAASRIKAWEATHPSAP
jgi:hypothetical protein